VDQILRDAVVREIEEADGRGNFAQSRSHRLAGTRLAGEIGSDIESGDFLGRIRMVHQHDGLVVVAQLAPHVALFQLVHVRSPRWRARPPGWSRIYAIANPPPAPPCDSRRSRIAG